jgi:hypothetical protein
MPAIPTGFAGALTIALIVGLGIFVYPWLLSQRGGKWIVAGVTSLLAVLFYAFDAGSGLSGTAALAVAAGLASRRWPPASFWRLRHQENRSQAQFSASQPACFA